MSSQESPILSVQVLTAASLAHMIRHDLHEGEAYAGLILGKNGAPDHHLILLPDDMDDVTWSTARNWATAAGGALPTRRELSLLHANLKEGFMRVWYWSAEQSEARPQLVWGQNFSSGIQTMYGRQFHGRARAVRRITSTTDSAGSNSGTSNISNADGADGAIRHN